MTTNPLDELLASARAGDRRALERLLSVHRHGVYRYGLRVCRTTEDAEDAVQETLWAATRAIHTFRGTATSLTSWLFTIVRRECLRLIEGRRREPPVDDGDDDRVADQAARPDAVLVARWRTELLARALASLEPHHREVILLRDIQEQSAPEAAAHLGISVDALKSRLHRARVELRDHVRRASNEF